MAKLDLNLSRDFNAMLRVGGIDLNWHDAAVLVVATSTGHFRIEHLTRLRHIPKCCSVHEVQCMLAFLHGQVSVQCQSIPSGFELKDLIRASQPSNKNGRNKSTNVRSFSD